MKNKDNKKGYTLKKYMIKAPMKRSVKKLNIENNKHKSLNANEFDKLLVSLNKPVEAKLCDPIRLNVNKVSICYQKSVSYKNTNRAHNVSNFCQK
ncbi:8184_t:CDS:2 [Gigaspora margarita]|uniref:8184_t:CDS:1 n=1 Tax=Gigaspora margarita TaxID=4874 RepID=A0ABN7UZR7_GIGMA|nr:8184_t:CDS:2 [Gigaspora margarita]